jgi:hypothetical protein
MDHRSTSMVTDAESEKLSAFLAMKRLSRYLERGRHLAGVGSSELRRKWLSIFRKWAKDLKPYPPSKGS